MRSKLFSLAVDEVVYFNNNDNKFELVNCPHDKKECINQLPFINKCFQESHQSRLDKDYKKAIESLQKAFEVTFDIQEESCVKCADLFRSTIIESVQLLHLELKDLTSGWLGNKRYVPVFEMSAQTLMDMNRRMNGLQ